MMKRLPHPASAGVLCLVSLLGFSLLAGTPLQAAAPAAPSSAPIDFNRQVLPLLSEHCFACHGPDQNKRKAKLRLDTKDGAFGKLRDGGHAIVPGKLDQSEVIARISTEEPSQVMPPPGKGKKLSPDQVALLKRWVEQGAPWAVHWSYLPPRKPGVPAVNDSWVRDPVDAFILARLRKEGLQLQPEASKTTLLRRITLDLTGLPPTPAEVDAFLADNSPNACEKVVDRLLQSPRFGEHWARMWLDAARYGDTHGLHLDNYREIWPYRDWVIKAFNRNLRFDQFIVEQLAGDLLPGATLDQTVATGFCRCHVTTSEGGSIEEEVYVRNVVDQVDTFGTVFLGMSVGCARCHDHKYDPITTKEYYQLFAFFNSIDGRALDGNAPRPPPVVRVGSAEQRAQLDRLQTRISEIKRKISDQLAQVKEVEPGGTGEAAGQKPADSLAAWLKQVQAKNGAGLPKPVGDALKVASAKRNKQQNQVLRDHFIEHVWSKSRPTFAPLHKELAAAEKELADLDKQVPACLVFKELPQPRPAYILKRGEYDQRGDPVQRGTPAFLPPLPADLPRNRLGLARWLVSRDHPLTARVAVNRLWQGLFGVGLVKTTEDFGVQGEGPSHPELLDFLAIQFQDEGWDVKRMLRRLVLSATYRQSSRVTPQAQALDPANRLLSRGPRYRLDAEMLRDQALFVSGLMVEKLGGPSVKPPQPYGLWEAVAYPTSNTARFTADTGDKVHRRSLYTFWKRTAPPPQMSALDAPSRESCLVRRERTNTPLQALLLLNEPQFVEAARALAERAMQEGGPSVETRLRYLFKRAAGRAADKREVQELQSAYRDFLDRYNRDIQAARKLIAVGESKPDSKLNPSELAALTMIANLVFNLDEMLNKG